MRTIAWKSIGELIGLLALVGSVLFVGVQLSQARKIAISSNDGAYMQGRIAIYNSINEHADIWIRGNAGDKLQGREAAIYGNLLSVLNESVYVDHVTQMRMGETSSAKVVIHDYAGFLYQHPGARRAWQQAEDNVIAIRKQLTADGNVVSFWRELILADLKRLDENSLGIPN
jgi:hypothetical protein